MLTSTVVAARAATTANERKRIRRAKARAKSLSLVDCEGVSGHFDEPVGVLNFGCTNSRAGFTHGEVKAEIREATRSRVLRRLRPPGGIPAV